MFQRKLTSIVLELLSEFRIVYLTGPRQAGKTTLAKSLTPETGLEYVSFDDQNTLLSAQTDPVGFMNSYKNNLIFDEFQYETELIPAIKQTSDNLPETKKVKFLLTGSADIFRSGKTQEALPGHMARLELYPLSIAEKFNTQKNIVDLLCNQNFSFSCFEPQKNQNIADSIPQGGYPEVQNKSARGKKIWFDSYIQGRLFKDFESLYSARGDYRSKLQALVPYLAGLAGNLIKYSNISNDLQEEDKLIKSYMGVLELMFIIKTVPAYIKNKTKREATTMPKLHMIDTGLACNLLSLKNQEQLKNSPYFGGLLENLLFMRLYKHNCWSSEQVNLFHFRDKYKNEVDIVLERENSQIIGVEVKASATIKTRDFKGLIKLAEFNPTHFQYGIVFFSGREVLPFSQNGIQLFAVPITLILK